MNGALLFRWVRHVLTIAMVVAYPRMASADEALAREHFRRGVESYDKKQYEGALESFKEAYAAKPSPGVKQNIALSLKGLHRPIEAASAFDEALDEGDGRLKPDVRAAIEKELVELSKVVATVRLKVVAADGKTPVEDVVVTVDGTPLDPGALKRPLRLAPGIHVFAARAPKFVDPPTKKLSLLPGSPVEATFELEEAVGTLTIVPSVANASVRVDGNDVARDAWPLLLPAGSHHVVVSAPGYMTTSVVIVVSPHASVEYPIALAPPSGAPSPYELTPRTAAPPEKKRYVAAGLAYVEQNLRLAPLLGERVGGAKRSFSGGTLAVRGGYRASKNFAVELHAELGRIQASYTIAPSPLPSSTSVVLWQLAPVLRFYTQGHVRFTMATGLGLHGLSVNASVNSADSAAKIVEGRGITASWLADAGLQLDVGPIFLEALGFAVVQGVGARDDVAKQRMILSSPSTRAGVRVGLGILF